MNILITGGVGYIGGRIAQRLLEQTNDQVTLTSLKQPLANLLGLSVLDQCEILPLDLLDDSVDLVNLCKGFDCIIHLAAVNEVVCAQDSILALEVNGLGALRVLNAAISAKVKRFIYFSTAHIYGAPLSGHLTEQTLPRPRHAYAITHKVAEDFVLAAHDQKLIEGVVIRLSNSFGAPVFPTVDRWTLLLNELAKQAVIEKKVTLKSTGMQYRDFVTLSDVCQAVEHLIHLAPEKLGDGLFNLGGQSLRVIDAVNLLIQACEPALGFKPVLELPVSTSTGSTQAQKEEPGLNYDCTKLINTGFVFEKNIEAEMQGLLKFCDHHFGARA